MWNLQVAWIFQVLCALAILYAGQVIGVAWIVIDPWIASDLLAG